MKRLFTKLPGIESLPELKFSLTMTFGMIFTPWSTFYKSAKSWIKLYKQILDYIDNYITDG